MVSRAKIYHDLTKYSPATIGQGHAIDWENPPAQFKTYAGADVVDLRPFNNIAGTGNPDVLTTQGLSTKPITLEQVSTLLFAANGITATATGGGQTHYFRASPSAGALYPTELYLLVREHPDLGDGVYNYHALQHALVEVYPKGLGPDGDELFQCLHEACLGHPALVNAPMALVATAIWYRSSWRYAERGYRRCLLDTGHVSGNIAMASATQGVHCARMAGFVDGQLQELLSLPDMGEGVLEVFALSHEPLDEGPPMAKSNVQAVVRSDPIMDVHTAGAIQAKGTIEAAATEEDPFDALVDPRFDAGDGVKLPSVPATTITPKPVELAIAQRRSTRRLSGEAVGLPEVADLLAFAYRPELLGESPSQLLAGHLLNTWVIANNVPGLDSGVYSFAPAFMELLRVRDGVLVRDVHNIALGQDLARDAALVVVHTANWTQAFDEFGDRAYRALHLDAGHIGERLNVAAMRWGLGVSGIGGFFDDSVNELLGVPEAEICIYITCLGRKAE